MTLNFWIGALSIVSDDPVWRCSHGPRSQESNQLIAMILERLPCQTRADLRDVARGGERGLGRLRRSSLDRRCSGMAR